MESEPSASGDKSSRMRIKIACEECRKNKRKCDGQKPACYLCNKFGRECLYASEQSRKRRHYDEDLVHNLENQIKILESALKSRSNNVPSTVSMSECEAPNTRAHDAPEDDARPDDQTRDPFPEERSNDSRSSAAMEELATLMLKIDIAERGEPSFMIAAGDRKTRLTDQSDDTADRGGERERECSKKKAVPLHPDMTVMDSDVAFRLPPELLSHLVDSFTTNFNSFHQFLDRADIADLKSRRGLNMDDYTLDFRFRNAALLSVAACFSSVPEARSLRDSYGSLADSLALKCIRERPNDIVVQGLTMLAWKELMFGTSSLAYNYIAMATGQILHLGLHVTALAQTPDGTGADQVLYKRRIRSFWAYFSVDRLLTSSLGMNCTMHWQRVRLHPFSTILDVEPTLDEAAHDAFCQLWHLWDSCMDQVYAFGWAHLTGTERESLVLRSHQSLTDFYHNIDDRLRLHRDYFPDSAVWFQMAYHTALLLIHRPLLNEPRGSSALSFALRSTTASATSISRIIRSYRRSGGSNVNDTNGGNNNNRKFTSLSPQVVDYILSAAVIHLLNATAGKTPLGRQSASGLKSCVDALEEIRDSWDLIATRALQKTREIAMQWKVLWALPVHLAGEALAEGVISGPGDQAAASTPSTFKKAQEGEELMSSDFPTAKPISNGNGPVFTNHHGVSVALGANVADLNLGLGNSFHHDPSLTLMADEREHEDKGVDDSNPTATATATATATTWNLNDCFWDDLVAEGDSYPSTWMAQ